MSAIGRELVRVIEDRDTPGLSEHDDQEVAELVARPLVVALAVTLGKRPMVALLEELRDAEWELDAIPTMPAPPASEALPVADDVAKPRSA
jgi:hypothetical protein